MADTKEQLTEILERYNIGKKPLARLLGWGETTVINQLKGTAVNTEFAEKINTIYESPYVFSEILEQNKDKLTEVAYRKTKKAVNELIMKNKASLVVQYLFTCAENDIAPYQVVADMFYAQVAALLLKGIPLFDDDVCYMKKSTVPYPHIYSALLSSKGQPVHTMPNILTQDEKDLLSAVNKQMNAISPNTLKAIMKADRSGLLRSGKRDKSDISETEGIYVSLSQLQAYFLNQFQESVFTDIKDFRIYWDRKLKKP